MQFKLKFKNQKNDLSQLAQRLPCTFAYVLLNGRTATVMHKPVLCRDFLLDTLAWISGEAPPPLKSTYDPVTSKYILDEFSPRGDVYGYNFEGPIERTRTVLYLGDMKYGINNLNLLHKLEQECGMDLSKVYETDKLNSFIIIGDKGWQATTVLMSLWTWAIRNFLYPKTANEIVYPEDDPLEEGEHLEDRHGIGNIWYHLGTLLSTPKTHVTLFKGIERQFDGEVYHSFNGFLTYLERKWVTRYAGS